MNIDGRYADATPNWLSIHKRWIAEPSNYAAGGGYGSRGKPFILKTESGQRLRFRNQYEFAEMLGVNLSRISVAMSRMRKHPDKKAVIAKRTYYLMEGKK